MKRLGLLLSLLAAATGAGAQITWPSAYVTATGSYTFNYWAAASTAATYPANMRFYRLSSTGDPVETDTIYQDYTAAYNLTSGTRLNGLDGGGCSFINTGNSVNKMGAAVLALNTTNQNNVQVTWTGKTVTPNNQEYEIRLYYRVGNTGGWTPVLNALNDTVRYVRSATAGDSVVKGPYTLPSAVNNKALVQLCWKYFRTYTNTATGTRAELAVNNIQVSSTGLPAPVLQLASAPTAAFLSRTGSNSISDSFTVAGSNLADSVLVSAPTGFELAAALAGSYGSSVTLHPSGGSLASTRVYLRFHPSAAGVYTGAVTATSYNASAQNFSVTGYTINSSNPAAFAAASGNYSMDHWDSLSAAATYPANMIFHSTYLDAPPLTGDLLYNDWTCGYNLAARPRITGLDSMGFAFINTSSPQYDNCSSGATVYNTFVGAAVLAVNTTGVNTIHLQYNAGLVKQGDGAVPRVYNLRLQYRTDTNNVFTDYAPVYDYTSAGKSDGDLETSNILLPASLEGLPYVQFRWLYYSVSITGASGSRPMIRLDNITVTSNSNSNGILALGNGNTDVTAYPNPGASGQTIRFSKAISGKIYNSLGQHTGSLSNAVQLDATGMAPGIYTIATTGNGVIRVMIQ